MSSPDTQALADSGFKSQSKLNARAARFNNALPGNRYKELEALRAKEREAFTENGQNKSGKTTLDDAVDLQGTCEDMCCQYEREFREFTREVNPFERLAGTSNRIDHARAVAAYTRSDAGAGHGAAAILPSDIRTPSALTRSLDYLIGEILPTQPAPNPNALNPPPPSERRALGNSAGFIRDRTRAIRKEFAIQSSWGHDEAIATFERIARWHILCLRELQEQSGANMDMHIDNAELGRCFTSLRQHYNDRREELEIEMPCPNEPEFRAYMLIYDLANKSVSITTSELPGVIVSHPLVKLAWQIRQAAQRNFDSQKEGSKFNSELGLNMITRFIRLLKQQQVPYLLSCLVEVRLRDMRRSAIRALTRTYPKLLKEPIRTDAEGNIVERRMILMSALDKLLGAETQESEGPAFDDIEPLSTSPDDESVRVVKEFGIQAYEDENGPVGAMINLASKYNDNQDAPFTRRWKFITEKKGSATYGDIINGKAGVGINGAPAGHVVTVNTSGWKPPIRTVPPPQQNGSWTKPSSSVFGPSTASASGPSSVSAFGPSTSGAFGTSTSAFIPSQVTVAAPQQSTASAFAQGTKSAFTSSGATSGISAFGPPRTSSTGSAFGLSASQQQIFGSKVNDTKTVPVNGTVTTVREDKSSPADSGTHTLDVTATDKIPSFFNNAKASTPGTHVVPTQGAPQTSDTSTTLQPKSTVPSFFPSVTVSGNVSAEPSSNLRPSPADAVPPMPTIPTFLPHSEPTTKTLRPITAPPLKQLPPPKSPSPPPAPIVPAIQIKRDDFRATAAKLRDDLIEEVLDKLLRSAAPTLQTFVSQRELQLSRIAARDNRQREIKRYARLIADQMIAEQLERSAKQVYISEQRLRALVRQVFSTWVARTTWNMERRAQMARDRQRNFQSLSAMGLRRSQAAFEVGGSTGPSAPSILGESSTVRRGRPHQQAQEALDDDLQRAEKARVELFAPSSFLTSITSHVAPLLRRHHSDQATHVWETVLLTAQAAGSPATAQARKWLASKFLPREDDEVVLHDDVEFVTTVTDVDGYLPGTGDAGLYVFEAPLITLDSVERSTNADDASDRLEAAAGAAQQRGKYKLSLLLLTWDDETLDDLISRLNIRNEVEQFDSVASMSLEHADDLDQRFRNILHHLIPSDPLKQQVVLQLDDVVAAVEPTWHSFVHYAEHVMSRHPNDAYAAARVFSTAVSVLSSLPAAVDAPLAGLPVSGTSTYREPTLPTFDAPASSDRETFVTALTTYLSSPPLDQMDNVRLTLGPLRQSSHFGAIPILPVLDALANFVMGSFTLQTIPLDIWLPQDQTADATSNVVTHVSEVFEAEIRLAISALARETRQIDEDVELAMAVPLPVSRPGSPAESSVQAMMMEDDEPDAGEPTSPPKTLQSRPVELPRSTSTGKGKGKRTAHDADMSPSHHVHAPKAPKSQSSPQLRSQSARDRLLKAMAAASATLVTWNGDDVGRHGQVDPDLGLMASRVSPI